MLAVPLKAGDAFWGQKAVGHIFRSFSCLDYAREAGNQQDRLMCLTSSRFLYVGLCSHGTVEGIVFPDYTQVIFFIFSFFSDSDPILEPKSNENEVQNPLKSS